VGYIFAAVVLLCASVIVAASAPGTQPLAIALSVASGCASMASFLSER
jgi:hypothetical protein